MAAEGDDTGMTDLQDRILSAMDVGEPYTARELAEEIGEPRRTVQYNLKQLAENGELDRKEHSKRTITYRRHS